MTFLQKMQKIKRVRQNRYMINLMQRKDETKNMRRVCMTYVSKYNVTSYESSYQLRHPENYVVNKTKTIIFIAMQTIYCSVCYEHNKHTYMDTIRDTNLCYKA